MKNQDFLIYRLTHTSQEAVYSWLENNRPKQDKSLFGDDRKALENSLLLRDEPLIKIGLALFGFEAETGLKLYRESDELIRKAVLSGPTIRSGHGDSWVESEGILNELLDSKNIDLLGALLSNPGIDDKLLVDLFEKDGSFEKIDDAFWFELVLKATSNHRLSTPCTEGRMDGWSEHSYKSVLSAGWKLFEKFPVNDNSASILSRLGERLVPYKPQDMEVAEVIERWYKDDAEKEPEYYSSCRNALANLLAVFENEVKDSKDIAIREPYCRRFSPQKKEEERELFEKDGEIPFDAIEDPVERANKQLAHVGRKIDELSDKLLEERGEEQSFYDEIRDNLNNIEGCLDEMKSQRTAPSYGWLWLIAGFLFGLYCTMIILASTNH